MKKLVFISCISLLLLSSCHPRPLIKWEDMPTDLFASYIPYQKGDTILFCSDDIDTLSYICNDNSFDAIHDCQTGGYVLCNYLKLDEISRKSLYNIKASIEVRIAPPYDINKKPKNANLNIYGCYDDKEYCWLERSIAGPTLYEIYTQDYEVASEDYKARYHLKKGEGIVWFEYEGIRYTQIK